MRVPANISVLALLVLAACSPTSPPTPAAAAREAPASGPLSAPLERRPLTEAVQPAASPPPTPTPLRLWIDPSYPGVVALPPSLQAAADRESADVSLVLGEEQVVSQWIYALVAPFYEVRDGVSLAEAHSLWLGQPGASTPGPILILSPETYGVLARWWGEASPEAVQRLPAEELLGRAWETRGTWAIIPFEALEPRWKVLALEGQSPIRRDFEPSAYPLAVPFSLVGASADVAAISAMLGTSSPLPASNRVPDKLSVVALTGVTALVRATAWSMEQWGVTYPAQDIGDWLRQADITHISNEVPFAENCPYPNPQQVGVVFCSDPGYIALLEDVGTDVVELTGDHLHDWGPEAMLYTLGLYEEHGWPVYGGGANYEEGRQPVYMTHNGNRLAFIGCNGKGGSFARASETSPGSVACDLPWMRARITELASQGIVVIVTFQHQEHYGYAVPANFMADFQGVAEAGAAIVSGSQAHHPHGFEFRGDGLIHYGLGNLFFDQYAISPGTRQGFVDRHVIYDGRHISTELLTLVFVDFARSRPMNAAERTALLQAVFTASGW